MKDNKLHTNHLKQNNFTVPKAYFNSLEAIVIAKLKAEALNTSEKNDIPKNYFDTLEIEVIRKVKQPKKAKFVKLLVPIAVAASLLIAIVLSNFNATENAISQREIESWLNLQMVDYTTLDLVSTQNNMELETTFFETISNTEIVDYLYETDIEYMLYEN